MPKQYVESNYGDQFVINLARLSISNTLRNEPNSPATIYLPFHPHFFHVVNSNKMIHSCFVISYLRDRDINVSNHKLHYSTMKNNIFSFLGKDFDEEERHIKTERKEVLDHSCG